MGWGWGGDPSFLLNKNGKGILADNSLGPGFKEGLYLLSRSKPVIPRAQSRVQRKRVWVEGLCFSLPL